MWREEKLTPCKNLNVFFYQNCEKLTRNLSKIINSDSKLKNSFE